MPVDEQFIKKITQVIDKNLHDEKFGAAELAKQLGISRVTLYRKVKSIVKKSVNQYIRETRLQRSLELLQKKAGTVAEISYMVGFNNPAYFNKCFHDFYGITPGDILKGIQIEELEKAKKGLHLPKKQLILFTFSIVLVILIFTIYFFMLPHLIRHSDEKITIVVPAFDEPNPKKTNNYLQIFREHLVQNLDNCENLNVASITIIDDLTKSGSSLKDIARELKADFILKGWKSVSDNDSMVWMELIKTKDNSRIWCENFSEIQNNIFEGLPRATLIIAEKLGIKLKDEEKEKLEEKPSSNIVALSYYEAGLNLLRAGEYGLTGTLSNAQRQFETAIQFDSTMSEAFVNLSHIYINVKYFHPGFDLGITQSYLDSGKILAQKAIQYDNKNAWAWELMAKYYTFNHYKDSANYCLKQNEKFSKRDFSFYEGKIHFFCYFENHAETIENFFKFMDTKPPQYKPTIATFKRGIDILATMNFTSLSNFYLRQVIEQLNRMNDTLYTINRGLAFGYAGNLDSAKYCYEKAIELVPDHLFSLEELMIIAYEHENYSEAIELLNKIENKINDDLPKPDFYKGLVYLKANNFVEANYHLKGSIDRNLDLIQYNRREATFQYNCQLDLATIYCALGDKEKALKYINECMEAETNFAWIYHALQNRHDFNLIRETEEFKKTFRYIENNYLKERKKVEKILIKENLLEV